MSHLNATRNPMSEARRWQLHGPIVPLEYPSLWQRIGYAIEDFRIHVGPVRGEWRAAFVAVLFGVMILGVAVVGV